MKKHFLVTLFLIFLFSLVTVTACGSGEDVEQKSDADQTPEASNETITFKLGHIGSLENEYHLMALKFKEEVEKRTDGRYQIEIYPARQLGGDREIIEAMQFGNVDCGVVTSSPMVNFVPELGVLDLPYIFKSWEHIENFAKSDALHELLKEAEKANLVNLAVLARGFRSTTNSKHPIVTPDDMKDIKLRVIESPVFIEAFKLTGATVIPMAAGEVYTALQQGTIDAQENTPAVNIYERFYEVQDYFSLTEHISAWGLVTFSKSTWDKIPPKDQKLIREAAAVAQEVRTVAQRENEAGFIEQLKEHGMEINEADKEAFAEVMRPVIDSWAEKNGDKYVKLIEEVE